MKSRLEALFEKATKPVQIKWGSIICAVLMVAVIIFPFSEMPTRYLDAVEEFFYCAGAVGFFAWLGGGVYHFFISMSTNDSKDITVPLWKHFAFWVVCVCIVVVFVFAKAGL